jgi:hypothetical protein
MIVQIETGPDRVRERTAGPLNARLDRIVQANLERAAEDPDFAVARGKRLDREWDIDRAILLWFTAMGGVALALGLRRDWRWRFPLAAQIGFMVLHATVGWSPPTAVLRLAGFRTKDEILAERTALLVGLTPIAEPPI